MKSGLRDKMVSADRAVQMIKRGDRVLLEGSLSEPLSLIEALIRQREHFEGVEILTASPVEGVRLADEKMASHFRLKTFFARGAVGEIIRKGRADYLPISLWGIVEAMAQRRLAIDVALVQLAPPDASGYCNFGINVSYAKVATQAARTVIAELNDRMPRSRGQADISIDELDWVCEASRPLPALDRPGFGGEERRIAEAVAPLIPSGATLEIGIGDIPSAVLNALREKEDLGFHSGMISDAVMDLVNDGIITNRNKAIDRGNCVASMAMGSRELYDWIHENSAVSLRPSTYTHAVATIAKLDRFVAINSGLQVDLSGQVNAEMVDGVFVAGIGGGLDFARGASVSRGGLSIIAMPSTGGGGRFSRILPCLPAGTPVTYHRSEVDFVVTEQGVADLRLRSLEERARALIQIAHPKFRNGLEAHLRSRH